MGVGSEVLVVVIVGSGTFVAVLVGLVISGAVFEGSGVVFIAGVSVDTEVVLSMLLQPVLRLMAKTRLSNKKRVFIFPDWLDFRSPAAILSSVHSLSFWDLLYTV